MGISAGVFAGRENSPQLAGQFRRRIISVGVLGYAAGGGEVLTPATLGFQKIHSFVVERNLDGTHAAYDYTNSKFKMLTAAGAEAAAAANGTFRCVVEGI